MKAVLVVLLALAAVACANDAAPSDVLVLSGEEMFKEAVQSNPAIMIEFYAPWCGHCKHFAPDYEIIATMMKGKVAVAKVDATAEENQELAQQMGVRGYPTFKFFMRGVKYEYNLDRSVEAMISFMEKCTAPMATLEDAAKTVAFVQNAKTPSLVGFFASKEGEEWQGFQDMAKSEGCGGTAYNFAEATGVNPADVIGQDLPLPAFVLFPSSDPKVFVVYKSPEGEQFSPAHLYTWSAQEFLPLMAEVSGANFQNYMDAQLPMVWLIADADTAHDAYRNIAAEVAKDFKHRLVFFWMDAKKFAQQATNLSPHTELPTVVITTNDGRFVMSEFGAAVTAEALKQFAESVLSGSANPFLKSEAAPESNEGPLYTIVGTTFKQLVLDDVAHDVFVKFYATWCGHCKALEPIYEELAVLLKDVPTIRIAQINSPENELRFNDIGFELRGFPTLVLYNAIGKHAIMYEGERTLKGMLDFLKEKTSLEFVAPVLPEEKPEDVEKMEL